MTDYHAEAKSDTKEMARYFIDEIVEQLIDDQEASDDINNSRRYSGGDSYHHESHIDHAYSLTEAAAILDQLSFYTETDSGLWEGLEPREAISAQAAYTYGAAVYSMWMDLISEINDDDDLQALLSEPEDWDSGEDGDNEWEADAAAVEAQVRKLINEF